MKHSIKYFRENLNIEISDLLDNIINSAQEYVYFKDTSSRFIYINEALMHSFGIKSMSEAFGKLDTDFYPSEFGDQTLFEEQRVIRTGTPLLNKEERLVMPNGSIEWYQASKYPLRDMGGNIVGLWGVSANISQLIETEMKLERVNEKLEMALVRSKEMENAAKQASMSKGQFLANMSHEIRTPLNAIIGLSELMNKTSMDEKQQDYNQKIISSAHALLGIINSILDYSKIEAGKMELERVPFDLDEILGNLASMLTLKAEQKGIELLFDISIDVTQKLIGDPVRFTQVLLNLVNNALKFTSEGYITLKMQSKRIDKESIQLHVEVNDTGIGMKQEQINKLFKPFSQADASTTRQYGGTGLGLSISKEIVELMGGEIQVTSTYGRGSNFFFDVTLPLYGESDRALVLPQKLKDLKVLVVDDNDEAKLIIERQLDSFGFNVMTANSGTAAIELIKKGTIHPELIVMDYLMPDMDGIETTQRIRELMMNNHVPEILMVSAYGKEEIKEAAKRASIEYFLDKPVNPSHLFDTILEMFDVKTSMTKIIPSNKTDYRKQLSKIKGARILLAEDNEINQQIAKELLSSEGLIIDILENGQDALDCMKKAKPGDYDLILMDIQMPIMDGREATRQIRKLTNGNENIPIVAMTAHALAEEKERNIKSGMNAQINKPIDLNEVFTTLIKYISEKNSGDISGEEASEEIELLVESIEVEGLNTKEGLERVMQNIELYIELLSRFHNSYHDIIPRIVENEKNKAFEENRIIVHTIKGSGGNLGAADLFAAAEPLEARYREGKSGDDAIPLFETELKRVVDGIHRYLLSKTDEMPDGAVPQRSISEMSDAFKELIEQLNDFNMDAQSTAKQILNKLEKTDKSRFEPISQKISDLKYEEATSELIEFLKAYDIN